MKDIRKEYENYKIQKDKDIHEKELALKKEDKKHLIITSISTICGIIGIFMILCKGWC